jgi:hypothetical protein
MGRLYVCKSFGLADPGAHGPAGAKRAQEEENSEANSDDRAEPKYLQCQNMKRARHAEKEAMARKIQGNQKCNVLFGQLWMHDGHQAIDIGK